MGRRQLRDNTLDTTYTYDDPAVPFSKGRLTAIARDGSTVPYGYDRFGRVTQDGELTYQYDKNANLAEISYPGGVTARFTHDFADREASLDVQVGSAAPQPIVSGATYKPFGPLAGFTSGNGLAEVRSYDGRYSPLRIEVPGRLDQAYTTDAVGNILSLNRAVGPDRFVSTFAYQDPQYFLTDGTGPWGRRIWQYDRIGNRLSEGPTDTDPGPDTFLYSYLPNATGGHTPKLSRIEPAPGDDLGSRLDYSYDAAGNETTVTALSGEGTGRTSFLDYSAESRPSLMHTSDGPSSTELLYDGRGFLHRSRLTATNTNDFEQTEPVYSSEGLLLARRYHKQSTQGGRGDTGGPPTSRVTMETTYVYYFAGRPIAQLKRLQAGGGSDTLLYLTTDHLGTPIQATDTAGAIIWEGGLEPFGAPFVFPRTPPPGDGDGEGRVAAGTASATMESAGIFLRFPGQWDDASFRSHGLRGGLYQNVHRYYDSYTSRYTTMDPLGLIAGVNGYSYVGGNPLNLIDPLGLKVELYCHPVGAGGDDIFRHMVGNAGYGHCFIRVKCNCPRYDLRLEVTGRSGGMAEIPANPPNFSYGHHASAVPFSPPDWDSDDCKVEECIRKKYDELRAQGYRYPVTGYRFGPNSNTFANALLRACGITSVSWPPGIPPFTD